jgi:hypothetical protein
MLRIMLRVAWWLMPFLATDATAATIVYGARASAAPGPTAPTTFVAIDSTPDGRDDPMFVYASSNQRIPGMEFMIPGP